MNLSITKNKDDLKINNVRKSNNENYILPFNPPKPLESHNFFMYIVVRPSSGKTHLLYSLLHQKTPRFYRGLFDKIYMFSPSMETLNNWSIHEDRIFNKLDYEELDTILKNEYESAENNNILIIFDDCIKDLQGIKSRDISKLLSKMILNRRHITYNSTNTDKRGSLSVIITSQKFNLLPLEYRTMTTTNILFNTSNLKEKNSIYEELFENRFSRKEYNEIEKFVFDKPHNFMLINDGKIYKNFDEINY
jgi:hypothetical protein